MDVQARLTLFRVESMFSYQLGERPSEPRAGHLEPAEVVQLPGEVQGHPVQIVEPRLAVTVPVHRDVAADVDERTPAGDLVDSALAVVGTSERNRQQSHQHAEVAGRIDGVRCDHRQRGQRLGAAHRGDERGHLQAEEVLARPCPQPIGGREQGIEILERDRHLERAGQQLLGGWDRDLDLGETATLQLRERGSVVGGDQVGETGHPRILADRHGSARQTS